MKIDKYVKLELVDMFLTSLRDQRDINELFNMLDLVERNGEMGLSDEYYVSVGRESPYANL